MRHGVGYISMMIHIKFGQGMRIHFGKWLNEHGMSAFIPVHVEKDALSFYQSCVSQTMSAPLLQIAQ